MALADPNRRPAVAPTATADSEDGTIGGVDDHDETAELHSDDNFFETFEDDVYTAYVNLRELEQGLGGNDHLAGEAGGRPPAVGAPPFVELEEPSTVADTAQNAHGLETLTSSSTPFFTSEGFAVKGVELATRQTGLPTSLREPSPDEAALFEAIKENKLEDVRRLLDAGVDPNCCCRVGNIIKVADLSRPFQAAASQGATEIMHFLHSRGARPNDPCYMGLTPLMVAAGWKQVEGVKALLNTDKFESANAVAADVYGQTALFYSVVVDVLDIVLEHIPPEHIAHTNVLGMSVIDYHRTRHRGHISDRILRHEKFKALPEVVQTRLMQARDGSASRIVLNSHLHEVKKLGHGNYGVTYSAVWLPGDHGDWGCDVVLKVPLIKSNSSTSQNGQAHGDAEAASAPAAISQQEKTALRFLGLHENCVPFIGVCPDFVLPAADLDFGHDIPHSESDEEAPFDYSAAVSVDDSSRPRETPAMPAVGEALVLEYQAGGDLSEFLSKTIASNDALSDRQSLEVCVQMARGLAHLHAQDPPMIHRDVRKENFLTLWSTELDGSLRLHVLLSDMGLARATVMTSDPRHGQGRRHIAGDTRSATGTSESRPGKLGGKQDLPSSDDALDSEAGETVRPVARRQESTYMATSSANTDGTGVALPWPWMAPEVFGSRFQTFTLAGDVWSLGLAVFEVFAAASGFQHPLQALQIRTADAYIKHLSRIEAIELPQAGHTLNGSWNIPPKVYEIICLCLQRKGSARPTAADVAAMLEKVLDAQRKGQIKEPPTPPPKKNPRKPRLVRRASSRRQMLRRRASSTGCSSARTMKRRIGPVWASESGTNIDPSGCLPTPVFSMAASTDRVAPTVEGAIIAATPGMRGVSVVNYVPADGKKHVLRLAVLDWAHVSLLAVGVTNENKDQMVFDSPPGFETHPEARAASIMLSSSGTTREFQDLTLKQAAPGRLLSAHHALKTGSIVTCLLDMTDSSAIRIHLCADGSADVATVEMRCSAAAHRAGLRFAIWVRPYLLGSVKLAVSDVSEVMV